MYTYVGCGGRYRCKFDVTTAEVASSQQELNEYAKRVSLEKLEKGVVLRPSARALGRLPDPPTITLVEPPPTTPAPRGGK